MSIERSGEPMRFHFAELHYDYGNSGGFLKTLSGGNGKNRMLP